MQTLASPELRAVPAEAASKTAPKPKSGGVPALLFFLLLAALLIHFDRAPRPVGENAPSSQFSAMRALKHEAAISRAPHPINSAEHDRVRDYLMSTLRGLGLDPQIQNTTEISERFGLKRALENIVARLKGSGSGKAVLLVAHYDSVPFGPGASDDGAAVAAFLESARALKSLPQLKRDVIFLFSDGEERGLLGARAFAEEHPWMNDVGVVLNFEARGNGGPSIMFETSANNGWLIQNFAQAASHPVANSLSYEIYKRLPNNTDFTVFRHAGLSGLNFAYIDGLDYYHTADDSAANLNPGSLQQHGDYVLEMTKQFGDASSDDPKAADAVYFDILGFFLVHYSGLVATALAVFTAVALAVILYRGFRKGVLRIGAVVLGILLMPVACAMAVFCAVGISRVVSALRSARIENGIMHHSGWYILAYCAAGLAVAAGFFVLLSRRMGAASLMAGVFVVWVALTLTTTLLLPGGSYLLLWPLLFSVLGWGVALDRPELLSPARNLVALLSVVPAFVVIVPMAHKIFFAFAGNSSLVVTSLAALLLSLLVSQFMPDGRSRAWRVPVLLVMVALAAFITAVGVSGA